MDNVLWIEEFTVNTLPMNDRQLDAFLMMTNALQHDPEHCLVLKMPNNEDPEEIRICWNNGGYYVWLSFPMDEIGWPHPLVLAAEGLEYDDVEMLVTEICVNQTGTENIELIMNDFRDVTSEVDGKD